MAFNVPSHDSTRFSFGPGILYIGAPGATPLIDIGAVRGDVELLVTRTPLELKQGSPQTLIKKYAVEEIVNMKITGVEWDFDNIAYALGAGVTTINGTVETLEFGGDLDYTNRALRFIHILPTGGTIDVQVFKAEGLGNLAIAVKETDFHEFPFEFNALEGDVDFSNVALATNKKKFKIVKTAP